MYTPLLERLLVVQIDSFPQYSEKMQATCCRSILKVLVAVASKGPVLLSFISSVGKLIMDTVFQKCDLFTNKMFVFLGGGHFGRNAFITKPL